MHLLLLLLLSTVAQGQGQQDEAKAFVGSLAECAAIDLDVEQCLVSSTIDILSSGQVDTSERQAGNNLRRILTHDQEAEGCKPEIDFSTIDYAVEEAASICATTNEGEISPVHQAFYTLFGDDEVVVGCWDATCSLYDGGEGDGDGDGDVDDDSYYGDDDGWAFEEVDIIGVVLDEAMQCPGVAIEPSSCLVSTALQGLEEAMYMDEVDNSSGGDGQRRRLIHSIPGLCVPPEIDEEEVRFLLEAAAASCSHAAGVAVDPQEIDAVLDSVMVAFGPSCFPSVCHRLSAEALAIGFDSAATCAGIAPLGNDCLTQSTIKALADEGADFQFPEMTFKLCRFGDLESEELYEKVAAVSEVCSETESTTKDIEDLTSTLLALFDKEECWSSYCPTETYSGWDDDDDYYSDGDGDGDGDGAGDDNGNEGASDEFFTKLFIDYLNQCSGATGEEPSTTSSNSTPSDSCLDTTMESILFGGGGGDGFGGTPPLSGTHSDAIQKSVVPVRRHLQQLQFTTSTAVSGRTHENDEDGTTAYGEFGNEEYPHHEEDEDMEYECQVPEVDAASLDFLLLYSRGMCENEGHTVTDDEVTFVKNKYTALFSASGSHCWEQLCHEEGHLMLLAKYFKDCASIDLPFANEHLTADDAITSCMLEYAMSTPHSEFGLSAQAQEPLDDPLDQCYPPGHQDVAGTCPNTIAPLALKHCTGSIITPPDDGYFGSMSYEYGDLDWGWGEDLFFEDQFFFSMSMSYGYGDSDDDDKPPPPPPVDPDRDARLMEDFCLIMEQLSSDKGKQCLLPLCGVDVANEDDDNMILETDAPSADASAHPSASPSLQPSAAPSPSPSASPSLAPSSEVTNGIVEIRYEAAITVDNLDVSSIPTTPGEALNKIVGVIETVLSQFLPENAEAKILSIGGIPVPSGGATNSASTGTDTTRSTTSRPSSNSDVGRLRRYRLLQADAGVEIEFEVVSSIECEDSTCTDAESISNQAYDTMTQNMNQAVDSGSLTSALQEEAAASDVAVLASITVDSFEADEPTVTITEGSDDESGATSTGITATTAAGLAGFVGLALCI